MNINGLMVTSLESGVKKMNNNKNRPDRLIFPSIRLCQPEWYGAGSFQPKAWDRAGLLVVEGGQITLSLDGHLYTAEAGERFWIAPGTEVGGHWEDEFRCSLLLFSCRRMERFGGQWLAVDAELPPAGRLKQDLQQERIPGMASEPPLRDRLELRHALHRWLSGYLTQTQRQNEANTERTHERSSAASGTLFGIGPVLDYMSEHYARELGVSELAALAGMSVNHFIRTFKSKTGRTPTQHLLHLRMWKARQLLFSTDKIKTVARSVGYRDEHYFSRAFKKAEGIAPAFYMKHPDRRIAAAYYGLDDYLRTLGLQPVAALEKTRRQDHSAAASERTRQKTPGTVWLDGSDFSYATLRRAKPDLILTSSRLESDSRLNRIAPTVTIPYTHDLPRQLRRMAEIVGKEDEAENWIQRYAEAGMELRQQLIAKYGRPLTAYYIRVGATLCRVYGRLSQTGDLLYDDLGMELPTSFPEGEWALTVSQEQLSQFDADCLFIAIEPTPEAAGRMRVIAASEEWKALKAVREGRIYDADDFLLKTLGPSGRLEVMYDVFEKLMGSADVGKR